MTALAQCSCVRGQTSISSAKRSIPDNAPHVFAEPLGADLVWSVNGAWTGAAVDRATGDIYSLGSIQGMMPGWSAEVWRFDRDGQTVLVTPIRSTDGGPNFLRLATLSGAPQPEFVTVAQWAAGQSIHVFNVKGEALWAYSTGGGLNDVVAADVDGDGIDELVVGCNGDGGLQVLRAMSLKGPLLWKSQRIGNTWSVAVSPDKRAEATQIVAVNSGNLVVFDGTGTLKRDFKSGMTAPRLVGLYRGLGEQQPILVVADSSPLRLKGLTLQGDALWSQTDKDVGPAYIDDIAVAPDAPLVAISFLKTGVVRVYDVRDGSLVASVEVGFAPRVAWVPASGDKPRILIAATYHSLSAFTVRNRAATNGQGVNPPVDAVQSER